MDCDYIVIGAGSAGCILAAGISDGGKNSVLLLESGPSDRHPYVKIPLGYGLLFNNKARNYCYRSAPEPNLGGRELYVPRGKTIGGSGSINAMVYCRGMPSDYESWKQEGLSHWGWNDVRPYFEAIEKRNDTETGIRITDPIDERHPFTKVFSKATKELGIVACDDFNGMAPEGVGFYHITTQGGLRHSSADAFLRPAHRKGWVKVLTNAVVQKIDIREGRAVGVTYIKNTKSHSARARKAVILAAGAINSPQILQVSGIGERAHMDRIGIETLLDNSNVGAHMQDHMTVAYHYKSHAPTLNNQLYSFHSKMWQTVKFLLTRRGPLSNSVNQYGGFIRTSPELFTPDQQLFFNPATYTVARKNGGLMVQPDAFPAFTLCFQPTRPTSRGTVRAVSNDITTPPEIFFNALSTKKDRIDVIAGGRFIADVIETSALKSAIKIPMGPSPDQMTDDEILSDFRKRCASVFHPCGTCTMGTDSTKSVVDSELRVHGIGGLYVADASVFPSIPSGNINAATLMVARRATEFILRHQNTS